MQRSWTVYVYITAFLISCCESLNGNCYGWGWGSTIKWEHGPTVSLTCSDLEMGALRIWLPCSCYTRRKPEPRVWVAPSELLFPNSNWADTWYTRFQLRSRFHLIHRASELHEYKMRNRRDCRCFLLGSCVTNSKVSLISIRNLAESLSIKQFNCIGFW